MNISKTQQAFCLMLIAALAGTWIAMAVKILSIEVSAITVFFLTRIIVLLGFTPEFFKQGFALFKCQRPWLMILMSSLYAIAFTLYFQSLVMVPLSFASLFMNSAPLYIPLLAYFILNDHAVKSKVFWLGLSVSFIGILLIFMPTGTVHYSLLGMSLAFVSGIILAISQVLTKVLLKLETPRKVVLSQVTVSAILSGIPSMYLIFGQGDAHLYHLFELKTVFIILTTGICSWYYQVLRARAVQLASVSIVMPFGYMGVIFIGIVDAIFWNVMPDFISIMGMVLVILGVITLLRAN